MTPCGPLEGSGSLLWYCLRCYTLSFLLLIIVTLLLVKGNTLNVYKSHFVTTTIYNPVCLADWRHSYKMHINNTIKAKAEFYTEMKQQRYITV